MALIPGILTYTPKDEGWTVEETPPQPTEIYGIVTEVDKPKKVNNKWCDPKFIIHAPKANINFHSICSAFCRVQPEDRIYARGYYNQTIKKKSIVRDGNPEEVVNTTYNFQNIETPIVEPGNTKQAIIQTFHNALPRRGRLGPQVANDIYCDLSEIVKKDEKYEGMSTPDKINMFMVEISNKLSQAGKELGDDVLTPFLNHIEKEQALKLIRYWFSYREKRKLQMLGLRDDDIKNSIYPTDILYDKVRRNPYTVACISLEKCHEIMRRFGGNPTEEQIRRGEILRHISDFTDKLGWSCIPYDWVRERFPDLNIHREALIAEVDPEGMTKNGYGIDVESVKSRDYVYLRHVRKIEVELTERFVSTIREHIEHKSPASKLDFDPVFDCKTLSEDQIKAITGTLNNPISVITGGGGSGKTTSIVEIVNNFELHKIRYAICSFTGKAVSRVREVLAKANYSQSQIGKNTFTLHRGLYSDMNEEGDLTHLIIDETSMVTTGLVTDFLRRYDTIKHIILVGDCNQLLPIGWGCFFKEIIASKCIPVYYLTNNHRTYKNGGVDCISENMTRMRRDPNEICFSFVEANNFRVLDGDEKVVCNIVQQIASMGVKDDQITIVTPYNKTKTLINLACQQIFRPNSKSLHDSTNKKLCLGDRVIMRENNYDIDVMNGEEGRIIEIKNTHVRIGFAPQALTDWVEGCNINTSEFNHLKKRSFLFHTNIPSDDAYGGSLYEKRNPDEQKLHLGIVDLAYCLTVHKSQGSEWNYVLVYIPNYAKPSKGFLNRNLVYTATSRGRAFVAVISNTAIAEAAANTKPSYKAENLAARLQVALPDLIEARNDDDIGDIYDDSDFRFENNGSDNEGDDPCDFRF